MYVLSPGYLPKRLVGRQAKIYELREKLLESSVVCVMGDTGVGKTTLVRLALGKTPLVDCSKYRSFRSVARQLCRLLGVRGLAELSGVRGKTVVFDDFTLAASLDSISLVKKISRNNRVIVIVHPWIRLPIEAPVVNMPPYSGEELYSILEDRVVSGNLRVSEEAIEYISRLLGYPQGPGSARLAIAALRVALEAGSGRVGVMEARYALRMLGLARDD